MKKYRAIKNEGDIEIILVFMMIVMVLYEEHFMLNTPFWRYNQMTNILLYVKKSQNELIKPIFAPLSCLLGAHHCSYTDTLFFCENKVYKNTEHQICLNFKKILEAQISKFFFNVLKMKY